MAVLPEQQDESLFSPADPPTRLRHLQRLGLKEKRRPLFMLLCIEMWWIKANASLHEWTKLTAHASLYDAIRPSASYFMLFPIRFLVFQRKISFEIKQTCKYGLISASFKRFLFRWPKQWGWGMLKPLLTKVTKTLCNSMLNNCA